jgi:ribosomal protein L39E
MSSNKSEELKTHLRTSRNKTPKGIFAAPVWIMQKIGKRIYNDKAKRNWKRTEFGHEFGNKKGD